MCMPTNLAIDDRLLDQARTVGGYRTKRETVNEALREFIQRRQRLELAKLAGKVEYDPKYDYKRERRTR
jgi:Arc/MetJ family transcription regulator